MSRLLILMQKHRMQVPQFNQMESIYTQILSVIDYNLSQLCAGNTQPERRLEGSDNSQKDGQQNIKLRVSTLHNELLQKRLAEVIKMQRLLKMKLRLNAQSSKAGLAKKVVIVGFNAHSMLIKNLKVELGLKLIVNKRNRDHIDDILICELKALIESKDLRIEELTAKHDQFIDYIKMEFGMVINLPNTDQSIEHLVVCRLTDMLKNRETNMRSQPNVAVQIVAERNRLLQKLKITFNLKFNQFENSETSEDNIIDELKDLVEKKLEKRSLQKINSKFRLLLRTI